MGIFTDLTGRKFGYVTVAGQADKNKHGQITWRALCDCGQERRPSTGDLTSGKVKSCGCKRSALCSVGRLNDLIGSVFGRLTVLSLDSVRSRKYYWKCRCECGEETVVAGIHITRGKISSCGCFRKETLAALRAVDITGRRFGMVIAEQSVGSRAGGRIWQCLCDCGKRKNILASKLTTGVAVSCGCAVHRSGPKKALTSKHIRERASADGAKRRAQKLNAGGSFTAEQIADLYAKQRGRCAGPGCGVKLGDKFHRDHRQALSRGGSNDIRNMELLCQPCNSRKHAKDPIAWAQENGRLL